LDETGKLFKRIIAPTSRLVLSRWESLDQGLFPDQYGSRERRSTVNAILRVRSLLEAYTGEGEVALAMSLDIVNAFNPFLWDRIEEAIRQFGFSEYLREAVWDYFRDRTLTYTDRAEVRQWRGVYCGVPQGSVLPRRRCANLLWCRGSLHKVVH
jgi:hypothetical protein